MLEVSGGADVVKLAKAVALAGRGVPRDWRVVWVCGARVIAAPVFGGAGSSVPVATGWGGDPVPVGRVELGAALKGLAGRVELVCDGDDLVIVAAGVSVRVPIIEAVALTVPMAVPVAQLDACCLPGVLAHVSRDDSRPVLTGVRVSFANGGVQLAATDSYRMLVRDAGAGFSFGAPADSIIVPRWVLACFAKAREQVIVAVDSAARTVSLSDGSRVVSERLIDGQFPEEAERLFPADVPVVATARKAALVAALAPFAGRDDVMRVAAGGFSCKGIEGPHALDWQADAQEFGVRASFLLDAVEAVPGEMVTISMLGPLRPMIVEGVRGVKVLVMPIRLAG